MDFCPLTGPCLMHWGHNFSQWHFSECFSWGSLHPLSRGEGTKILITHIVRSRSCLPNCLFQGHTCREWNSGNILLQVPLTPKPSTPQFQAQVWRQSAVAKDQSPHLHNCRLWASDLIALSLSSFPFKKRMTIGVSTHREELRINDRKQVLSLTLRLAWGWSGFGSPFTGGQWGPLGNAHCPLYLLSEARGAWVEPTEPTEEKQHSRQQGRAHEAVSSP